MAGQFFGIKTENKTGQFERKEGKRERKASHEKHLRFFVGVSVGRAFPARIPLAPYKNGPFHFGPTTTEKECVGPFLKESAFLFASTFAAFGSVVLFYRLKRVLQRLKYRSIKHLNTAEFSLVGQEVFPPLFQGNVRQKAFFCFRFYIR